MNLKYGLIGLTNSGKSSIFEILSSKKSKIQNTEYTTIEPINATISIPNPKLNEIATTFHIKETIPTHIQLTDLPGLSKGSSEGLGVGNQFLNFLNDTNIILHVVPCFDENIDIVNGIEIIKKEIILFDIEKLKKILKKINTELQSNNEKTANIAKISKPIATKLLAHLENNFEASTCELETEDKDIVTNFHLISFNPTLYLCNFLSESDQTIIDALLKKFNIERSQIITIENTLEFTQTGDQATLLTELLQKSKKLLNLNTFYTKNNKQIREWITPAEVKAPIASRTIHQDLENNFNKISVINYSQINTQMKTYNRDYIVMNDDIITFENKTNLRR